MSIIIVSFCDFRINSWPKPGGPSGGLDCGE